jgi:hypothetical protein
MATGSAFIEVHCRLSAPDRASWKTRLSGSAEYGERRRTRTYASGVGSEDNRPLSMAHVASWVRERRPNFAKMWLR